jgi:anhydro-N-acetylmuramic acid kinase
MTDKNIIWALGLMSGTSLDGVDAALIRSDGERVDEAGPSATIEYDPESRALIRSVLGGQGDIASATRVVTDYHAKAVDTLLQKTDIKPDLIGFHGQTILHEPDKRKTLQIGDGARLAEMSGIDVVNDFRSADVAAGGQGAPFAPLYHAALARDLEKPLVVLNIGGVGNVTWIGDQVVAFDTGPGNALMDDLMLRMADRKYDTDGALARTGRPDMARVEKWLSLPYFQAPAPKSLDRDDFVDCRVDDLPLAEGLATLAAFTIASIQAAQLHFPVSAKRWLVTGGGRHNDHLMEGLENALNAPVVPVEAVSWRGDALEAEAFAFLAVRSLRGLPLSLPTTTGVPTAMTGGTLHKA